MYDTETKLGEIGDSDNIADKFYNEGRMDALTEIYSMTYNLAFAINERTVRNDRND
jgi:glutamine cyclotransferase